MKTLFDSVEVAGLALKNRLAMAPMTRSRAEGGVPGRLESLIEPCALPAAELARLVGETAAGPVRFTGTGALRYRDMVAALDGAVVIEDGSFPSTAVLAGVAAHIHPVPRREVPLLEPVYLRPSGAERKRLRPIEP